MHQSFVGKLFWRLSVLVAVLLVTAALAATAVRILFAYAPSFRAETESILSRILQRPVTVSSLSARWHGLRPQLILKGVKLAMPGASTAGPTLNEVDLTLGLSIGVNGVAPRASAITVKGLSITVERSVDGSLHLAGLAGMPLGPNARAASQPASWPSRVELSDSNITLVDQRSHTRHRISQVDLLLRTSGASHRLSGALRLPSTREGSARFIVQWSGSLTGGFNVNGYVDARDLDYGRLDVFLSQASHFPRLRGGGDARFWLAMKDGRLTRLTGTVSLHDAAVRPSDDGAWIALGDALTARFDWRQTKDGWGLDVDRFAYARGRNVWPASRFSVRYRSGGTKGGGQEWRVAASRLRLEPLARLAAQLPWVSTEWKSRLADMGLQGSLLNVGASAIVQGGGRVADWFAQGALHGVSVNATDKFPGASGLNGHFKASSSGGWLDLAASDGNLQIPRLFRAPLPFDRLNGRVAWRSDGGGWTVSAPDLALASADGRLWVRLAVTDRNGQGPFADVRFHGENGNAAHTSRYLPVGIMDPRVVDWLDHSIQAGTITSADGIYYGAVKDFPFDNGTGALDVTVHVRGGRLKFQPDWPALRNMDATLRFTGRQMRVTTDHATISGATVDRATASIDNLKHAYLKVDADGRGSGAAFLNFLKQSPLSKGIRSTLDELRVNGAESLALKLGLPIGPGAPSVQGLLTLGDSTLSAPSWNLAVSGLHGSVGFDTYGIDAHGLEGVFRGQPISVNARTVAGRSGHRIKVTTRLRSSVAGLLGLPQTRVPSLRGNAYWDVELDFPGFLSRAGQRAVNVALQSNLQGIASDLPEPLTKPAGRATALHLDARLTGGRRIPVRLDYGGKVRAAADVSAQSGGMAGAVLVFGSGGKLPREVPTGISLRGSIPRLDLDRWRAYLGASSPGLGASGTLPRLREVDLVVDRLTAFRQTFNRTIIHARNLSNGWQVNLGGQDVSGSITQTDTPERRIAVNLDRLVLAAGGVPGGMGKTAKPTDIPATAVDVRHLTVHGKDYGRLRFRTRPVSNGVQMDGFSLKAPALDVSGSGSWKMQGAATRSAVALSATSSAPGKALAMFNFANMVQGGSGKVEAQLQWGGSPWGIKLANLSGGVDLTLKDGQLPKVQPGAGRIFGLLSIANLPRRLSLNFADLFDKGFAYDTIHGKFRLEKGNAYPQDFVMEGPAANVAVTGRIGLAARDYDQTITVTPQVSSTLPIVAGLAGGGPVGAVAAFVAQKLFHKEIDSISRYRYRVTGSWDNPKVEPLEKKPQANPGKQGPGKERP